MFAVNLNSACFLNYLSSIQHRLRNASKTHLQLEYKRVAIDCRGLKLQEVLVWYQNFSCFKCPLLHLYMLSIYYSEAKYPLISKTNFDNLILFVFDAKLSYPYENFLRQFLWQRYFESLACLHCRTLKICKTTCEGVFQNQRF